MSRVDFEELMNVLIPSAQRTLSKARHFHPLAASMTIEGKIKMAMGYTGDEDPTPDDQIALLTAGLQEDVGAGLLRAVGICYDVRITPPGATQETDAICVRLEHSDGEAAAIYVPYKKGWLSKVEYADLFGTKHVPTIFRH
jgi:hypothetical protein